MRILRTFATCLLFSCSLRTPVLFGQQDVRAVLIAQASRKPAPAFHLAGDTGKTMQIADYQGKVVLLNFWATACGGCVLEIPSFIALEQTYKDKGFTAVGVAMDISYEQLKDANEAWSKIKPFAVDHKINYPILMGDESTFDAYGAGAYPATYLIDKSGRIAATYVGVVDKKNVEENLKALLSEH
jgi:peroxiredoxin